MYYKVVAKDEASNYVSAMINEKVETAEKYIPLYKTIYKMYETIRPKVAKSKLMVFGTLQAALKFAKNNCGYQRLFIFECEVTEPKKLKCVSTFNGGNFDSFWNDERLQEWEDWLHGTNKTAPVDSYACDSVRLENYVCEVSNVR